MAVTKDDLLIGISIDTKNASQNLGEIKQQIKSVDSELKNVSENLSGTAKAFGGAGFAAIALNQGLELATKAFHLLLDPIEKSIHAFTEAQDGEMRLGATLRLLGERDVQAAVEGFKDFTKELQVTTVVEDDHALKLVTMAKAIGLSDEMTKKLVKTSADLSAVTGRGVDESFQGLLETLKGAARGVATLAPELKNLTEEELKSGKGVDILAAKFQGFAETQVNTFAGTLAQTKNILNDIMEDVGGLILEALDLNRPGKTVQNFLLALKDGIAAIKPTVLEIAESVRSFARAVIQAISAIDFKSLIDNFKNIGIMIAIAFGPQAIAALASLTAALAAAAIPAIILAAKIILIGTAIAAVAVAIDLIVRNFSRLGDIAIASIELIGAGFLKLQIAALEFVATLLQKVGGAFADIASLIGLEDIAKGAVDLINKGVAVATEASQNATTKIMDDVASRTKDIDFGFAGAAFEQGKKAVDAFNTSLGQAKKVADDTSMAAQGIGRSLSTIVPLSDEARKSLEELKKKVEEIAKKTAEIGQSEANLARLRAAEDLKSLAALEEKLKKQKALTPETLKQLEIGRQAAAEGMNKQFEVIRKKNLQEVIDKNKELEEQIRRSGMLQLDLIEDERQKQLAIIAKKREQLSLEADINAEALKRLDTQEALINKQADMAASKAPSREFEAPIKAAQGIGESITSAFAGGAMGFMTGVGMVADVVQGLIDFIPQLLGKIQNILASFTALPTKIMDGVKGVFDAALKLISDFIPNLFKAVEGILDAAVSFVEKIPETFAALLEKLPELINHLLDRLPDIAEKLVTGLITNSPKLMIAWIEFLIKEAPRIAIRMAQVFYIELPKAIIRGIIEGVKQIGGMISDLFKGNFPKLSNIIDDKAIVSTFKNAAKTLTGETSKLFAVMDLTDAAKGVDQAKEIAAKIEDGMKRAGNWLKKIWDSILKALLDAWKWIYANIIQPIIDALTAVWRWIYDNVIQPFLDALTAIWDFFKTQIVDVFATGLTNAFNWFKTNVVDVFSSGLQTVWNFAKDNVSTPLINGLTDAWKKFEEKVVTPLKDAGSKIWEGLRSGLDGATAFFHDIGMRIWNGLSAGLGGLKDQLQNIFNQINPANLFEKIFRIDYQGKGTVERTLGIDIPFANFATGGVVAGNAATPGDSVLNDRILALLSPGEAVIPRSLMNDPAIRALIEAIIEGKLSPQKLWGGSVSVGGVTVSAGSDGVNVSAGGNNGVSIGTDGVSIGGTKILPGISDLDPRKLWERVREEVMKSVMKMFEANKFHTGGLVPAFASGGEVPSLLKPGEFVVSQAGVSAAGLPALSAINRGSSPALGSTNITIDLDIKTTEPIDETFIRNRLMPRIKEEFRRASLDGAFIISGRGVRST